MARIRSIHPDTLDSATLARLADRQERTWWRLLLVCDDAGRALADPRYLKGHLYPFADNVTAAHVAGDLDALEEARLIGRWLADPDEEHPARHLLAVRSWDQYQHPARPTPSRLPEPPADLFTRSTKRPEPGVLTETQCRLTAGDGDGDGDGDGEHARPAGELEVVTADRLPVLAPDGAAFDFAAFWSAYPRKVAKTRAESAWRQALKRDGPDLIASGLATWRAFWNRDSTEPRFIPHPTTWLRESRYVSDPPPPARRVDRNTQLLQERLAAHQRGEIP